MALTFVFEGITVQHAAELLFDIETTRADRKACRYTYLRSLEDFGFGLLAGDVIAVSRNLPAVGTSYPGRDLLEFISRQLPGHVRWIDDAGAGPGPGGLLLDPNQRRVIGKWLDRLGDAIAMDGAAWKEHMTREFRAYAGSDPSLALDLPPDQYAFEKNFWTDRGLEDAVPSKYVDTVLQAVPLVTATGIPFHENARKEFVRRNVVAHVLIWQWYREEMIKPQFAVSERNSLTHVTRASLVTVRRLRRSRPGHEAWRIIVPRLLAGLMNRCTARSEVLRSLLDVASGDAEALAFRHKCEGAIAEFVAGRDGALEKLRADLEAWARQSPLQETVDVTGTIGFQAGLPKAELGSRRSSVVIDPDYEQFDRQMRILVRSADRYPEYEAAAERLFPELR